MRYEDNNIVTDRAAEQKNQVVLPFGKAAHFVSRVRQFIFENGAPEAIDAYKEKVKAWHDKIHAWQTDPTVSSFEYFHKDHKELRKNMLEMELHVQRDVFKNPHDSLTGQFGFKDLLEEFRATGYEQLLDGFDNVKIEKPSKRQTLLALWREGWQGTQTTLKASLDYGPF